MYQSQEMSVESGCVLASVQEEMNKLGKLGSLEDKFHFEVISDPNLAAKMVDIVTSGMNSDASSESSTSDPVERRIRSRTRTKISKDKTFNGLNSRKIHDHKNDKTWFDSYNVFNRQMPPKNVFANAEDDFGSHSKAQSAIGGGDGPDEAPGDVTIPDDEENVHSDSEASSRSGQHHRKAFADSKRIQSAKATKTRRQNPIKRLQRKKILKLNNLVKQPVSQEQASEIAKQAENYLKALSALANGDQNVDEQETTELEWNVEKNDSGCDDYKGSEIHGAEESQLALFKTIADIRDKSGTSGVLWNCGLLFVDQGLAYNRMAQARRTWVNDKGAVITDLSDPAMDAVRLVGLSMGGLIVPKSGKNPYDYTNSYLEAMMYKYPVLCPENKTGHLGYEMALNRVAEMFPVIVTTHYRLMGDPQLTTMAKLGYGLPLAIYLEGFPSLVCQHHLEKDYNILPFLMVSMIIRLGPLFKEANPVGRLEMAKIAWKHLKKSIDSTSLPWYFRELFCRKYSICKDPDFYPAHGRAREKATMDLGTLVGHPEVSSLLAQIDEYDFRKQCPSANDLQPTKWDMYYMNIFYSRAVKHLEVGHNPAEHTEESLQNNSHNPTKADYGEEIETEGTRQILGSTNRLIENPKPDEDQENPKNRWFINLEDEIE